MLELVVASRNSAKVAEIKKILEHLQIKVLSLEDFPDLPDVPEDGATYEENAVKKAKAVHKATKKMALADDSGLEIDALQGQPGVRSARFGGEEATDHEKNVKVLKMMEGVADDQRGATFVCTVAIVGPGLTKAVQGSCRGHIIRESRGGGGFGYDPIFVPSEYNQTFAELLPEVKNKISHRARALEKATMFLEGYVYSKMEE